jgi:hypothetical protein
MDGTGEGFHMFCGFRFFKSECLIRRLYVFAY